MELTRAIGRWSLTALVINGVLGSSVFGLPSVIAAKLGAASPWPWVIAALGMGVIILCFAEVASRFHEAGGPYLYASEAYGRLAGVEMGWLSYLVRLTASATNANLFIIYLAEFWPEASRGVSATLVLAVLLGVLGVINLRGVGGGVRTSNLFAVVKLASLLVFVGGGTALVLAGHGVQPTRVAVPRGAWLDAILLLVFAYGGFEAALFPMAEATDPRRDAPVALGVALSVIALIYVMTQVVVIHALPEPGQAERPLAAAAAALAGQPAATLMTLAALASVAGLLAGSILNAPRLTYAMAERGDLPPVFAQVHPRFQTPWISLVAFIGLTWALAVSGSFLQNLTLSTFSRLITYVLVCLAVPRLRRRADLPPPSLRLPAAPLLVAVGTGFSLLLIARITAREAIALAVTLVLGLMNWAWVARRKRAEAPEASG